MKCVLSLPSWSLKQSHTRAMAGTVAGVWPPPGLMSIAAVLRNAGHEVTILDGTLLEQQTIVQRVREINPGFMGIYAVGLIWPAGQDLARRIKEVCPDTFIVVGGPYPSFFKDKCLKECTAVDAVCFGEGEYTARDLVSRLELGESLSGCLGSIFRSDDKIIHNQPRPLIENIDELPYYALDLVEMHKYRPPIGHHHRLPIAQMMSARGCPNECIYCYKVCGPTIRMKSPKRVVDEMEYYARNFGVREIKFWDDLFTYDAKRVFDICEEILRRRIGLTWMVASRVDTVTEEMLRIMAKAGCWCILYGIETAVQKNQAMIRKNLDLSKARQAIQLSHKYGIRTYATFILGIPGETHEEGLETIRFAKKLNAYFTEFFTFTPFPGSPVYREVEKYGVMNPELTKTGMHQMGFVPYSMTKIELADLCSRSYKAVYLRPRYVIRQILSIRSFVDLINLLRGGQGIFNMILGKHHNPMSYQTGG